MPKRSLKLGGQTETPVLKRVDFEKFMAVKGNGNRPLDIAAMEQMQDSLIARKYNLPQRLAILSTAAQEMGTEGAASRGVGGNGYLGLSEQRMPLSYLGNTPKKRGEQIHYLLEDLNKVHSDNWHHGGSGGISIKTGQEGFDKFWNENNVWNATQILNKSYIRPRDRQAAWDNRSTVAKNMQKYLYQNGGIVSTPVRREDIRPSLANGGIINKSNLENAKFIYDYNSSLRNKKRDYNYYLADTHIANDNDTIPYHVGRFITKDQEKGIKFLIDKGVSEDFIFKVLDESIINSYYKFNKNKQIQRPPKEDEHMFSDDIWWKNNFANGGGIYIKPSHRGRLTELKARTGKTESELYNDGNPDHKRMVAFARASRKWKH